MTSDRAYVNVFQHGNFIYETYYEGGERKTQRVKFEPSLAIQDHEGPLTTPDGKIRCKKKDFESISAMREFVDTYSKVENFSIFNEHSAAGQYITQTYPGDIQTPKLRVHFIDIEVYAETGFPKPEEAKFPIVSIATYDSFLGKYVVLGLKPWEETKSRWEHLKGDIKYLQCTDETHLLQCYLTFMEANNPDVITGWFISTFDIPYIVNRITSVLGETEVKRLSPVGRIYEKKVKDKKTGREQQTYQIIGLNILDYVHLYQKFIPQNRERYGLDYIAQWELKGDHGKLDYMKEFGVERLSELYEVNHQVFIDYNIRDVELVKLLDDKLGLISLAVSIAYMSKVGIEDIYSPVRVWESLIYNYIQEKGTMVTPARRHPSSQEYEGAYVKPSIIGMHDWVVSFDVNSMYPSALISNNISPDRKVSWNELPEEVTEMVQRIDKKLHAASVKSVNDRRITDPALREHEIRKYKVQSIVDDDMSELNPLLLKHDLAFCANRTFFRRGSQGIISEIVQIVFEDRVATRAKKAKLEDEGFDDKNFLNTLHQRQWALKVLLNSLYGAYANRYFLYYDVELAEAITLTSQVYIKSLEKDINDYLCLKFGEKDYVVAMDTDSVYVVLADIVKARFKDELDEETIGLFLDTFSERVIQPIINKTFEQLDTRLNSQINYMKMKREKICRKMIVQAKKKYAFLVVDDEGKKMYDNPEVKVTGIEVVKSSTPAVVRAWLKEAINIMFRGDNDDLHDFTDKCRKEFKSLPFEDVAFPRSVGTFNKYIGATKGITPQARGSFAYNALLKRLSIDDKYVSIAEGDKMKFAYLLMPNNILCDIFSVPVRLPKEMEGFFEVDYKIQFNKAFISPLNLLITAIGWSKDRTFTLGDFMSM